ncbi:MAG: glycoside hydrolase family 78 protein [Prevotellaceae bacterium]|jgi:hypothetical protein|nr:glycoside hydrolase family 78 protein [Prevotellaceae bacterium]
MKATFYPVFLLCTAAAAALYAPAYALEVKKATCEMQSNPLGVDAQPVRFGWQLQSELQGDRQTAYHLIVASSKANIDRNIGNMWDSREVQSSQSQLVRYGGKPLKPGAQYYWKVMAWDAQGKPSGWSSAATFDLAPAISDLNVRWIGAIKKADSHLPDGRAYNPPYKKYGYDTLFAKVDTLAKRSILLRKAFTVEKKAVRRAMAYISGLGHYELSVNGKRVGASAFAPLWSDYDKTIYYNTYDVGALLAPDRNAVGVMLGNGFYNCSEVQRYSKFLRSFGPPTLFFRMEVEYADGATLVVASDNSWRYAPSPITFNSIYGGEDYDANLEQAGWDTPEFDDSRWQRAVVQESPQGKLRPQQAPPVKVMQRYGIRRIMAPQKGIFVLDMGQNLSGYPTIKVKGKKGQTVRIYPVESLTPDSLVSQQRTGSPCYFEYTLCGSGVEEWTPRFSYYGYRYLQVENVHMRQPEKEDGKPLLLDVTSNFVYSSVDAAGEFECSNDIFNQAHRLISNAVKSNMQAVFTDCPHREKLGWLEAVHLNAPGLLSCYNLSQFFPKTMQDIADGQHPNGLVPNIAPEYTTFSDYNGNFSDSPEWGATAVILPWMYYHYYGDSTLIARYFGVMHRYVDYLSSRAAEHIVLHGLGDWYDYGDFAAGFSRNTPVALSATAHYYCVALLTAEAAAMLRMEAYEKKYRTLAENIRWAFNSKFFDADSKQYGTGSQASNAMPLFMGIVEPQHRQAVLENLVKDVQAHGNRLTTGYVGSRYLYQALARNGCNDVMYAMHNHCDVPGYGFQLKLGLTTLAEQWDPRKGYSQNHFMMGQIEEWFFCSLAGITPDDRRPGFSHFHVAPAPVAGLTYVKASHASPYGDVKVRWTSNGDVFTLNLTVPVNATASVNLPDSEGAAILVNGEPLAKTLAAERVDSATLLVGSGEYTFCYSEK